MRLKFIGLHNTESSFNLIILMLIIIWRKIMLLVQAPINSREESTAKRIQCKYDESRKLRSTKKTVSGRRTCVCQIFSPRQWKFYSPNANMVRNFFLISLLLYKIFENRLASGAMEPRGWPKPLDTAGSGLNLLLCA